MKIRSYILLATISALAGFSALAQQNPCSRTYTLDADFDEGWLQNVNHNAPNNNQLQLNAPDDASGIFPMVWIACSDRGTVVCIDANTGDILGEFRSAPDGYRLNPSRTTVDYDGNCWVANRDEDGDVSGVASGSVIKFGLVIGGTRVDANGNPDPDGGYLKPPFKYSTAVDRDGDGLIRTSRGLGDILDWYGVSDGSGGATALVEDAEDERILIYQRLPQITGTRHCSVDHGNDLWVGGYPGTVFHKLEGGTGRILRSIDVSECTMQAGYGGLIDKEGVIWSTHQLMSYDPATDECNNIEMDTYGLAMDPVTGEIWFSYWDSRVYRVNTQGVPIPGNAGGDGTRGLAVSYEGEVWVANSLSHNVGRVRNDGTLRTLIPVGETPTGVAIDVNGKIWVSNYESHSVMRIDPDAGTDGLGAVDLTIDLGAGAGPYNYSDMTGVVAFSSKTWGDGAWTIEQEACPSDSTWGRISWTSDTPHGTSLTVEARIKGSDWTDITDMNGITLCGTARELHGRYLEVRVGFSGNATTGLSPVLYDLTIEQCESNCLVCAVTAVDTVVISEGDSVVVPPRVRATLTVQNTCNEAVSNVECEIQVPSLAALASGETARKIIPTLGPGESASLSWDLIPVIVDKDTSWRFGFVASVAEPASVTFCGYEVFVDVIPNGSNCLECTVSAVDSVYVSAQDSVLVPPLLRPVMKVKNTCSTELQNVECEIGLPGTVVLAPGEFVKKAIVSLAAGETEDVSWNLHPLFVDSDTSWQMDFSASVDEPPSTTLCTHSVKSVLIEEEDNCLVCTVTGVDTVYVSARDSVMVPGFLRPTVRITNTCSTELRNVTCEIRLPGPIVLGSGEWWYKPIPSIPPGGTVEISWDLIPLYVDRNTETTMLFIASVNQPYSTTLCSQSVQSIIVNEEGSCLACLVSGADTVRITTADSVIAPGQIRLEMAVANICNSPMTDVVCAIQMPPYAALAGWEQILKIVPSILPGDTAYVSWTIFPLFVDFDTRWQVVFGATSRGSAQATYCAHTVHVDVTKPPDDPLTLSRSSLYFTAVQNGPLPMEKYVDVRSSNPPGKPWTSNGIPGWLRLTPSSAQESTTVTVQPNTTALAIGRHQQSIEFAGSTAHPEQYLSVIYDISDTVVVTTASVTVEVGRASGSPGEVISIPVYLRNPVDLALSGASSIAADLQLNPSVLYPAGATPLGSVINGKRIIPVSLPLVTGADEIAATFDFIAMLGTEDRTSIIPENSTAIGGDISISEIPGEFILDGVCYEGGARQFDGSAVMQLTQNVPNPFNATTRIGYSVIEEGPVTLEVYDHLGRRVRTLVSAYHLPGSYTVIFDAGSLPTGIYRYVLRTTNMSVARTLMLVK